MVLREVQIEVASWPRENDEQTVIVAVGAHKKHKTKNELSLVKDPRLYISNHVDFFLFIFRYLIIF